MGISYILLHPNPVSPLYFLPKSLSSFIQAYIIPSQSPPSLALHSTLSLLPAGVSLAVKLVEEPVDPLLQHHDLGPSPVILLPRLALHANSFQKGPIASHVTLFLYFFIYRKKN
jgi:hypothetical protein